MSCVGSAQTCSAPPRSPGASPWGSRSRAASARRCPGWAAPFIIFPSRRTVSSGARNFSCSRPVSVVYSSSPGGRCEGAHPAPSARVMAAVRIDTDYLVAILVVWPASMHEAMGRGSKPTHTVKSPNRLLEQNLHRVVQLPSAPCRVLVSSSHRGVCGILHPLKYHCLDPDPHSEFYDFPPPTPLSTRLWHIHQKNHADPSIARSLRSTNSARSSLLKLAGTQVYGSLYSSSVLHIHRSVSTASAFVLARPVQPHARRAMPESDAVRSRGARARGTRMHTCTCTSGLRTRLLAEGLVVLLGPHTLEDEDGVVAFLGERGAYVRFRQRGGLLALLARVCDRVDHRPAQAMLWLTGRRHLAQSHAACRVRMRTAPTKKAHRSTNV